MDAERSLATIASILMALGSIVAATRSSRRSDRRGGSSEANHSDQDENLVAENEDSGEIEDLVERLERVRISKRLRDPGGRIRLPPPDVKRTRFDEDEIMREIRDKEQIRRIANQPGAKDFTSLPDHLRSVGGVEVYRAMFADQWTWRALTGALTFAHARGGQGRDITMAKISSMLETSPIMNLPLTLENEERAINAFSSDGRFDVTRMAHAVLTEFVKSSTVQLLLFRFPALVDLMEPAPGDQTSQLRRMNLSRYHPAATGSARPPQNLKERSALAIWEGSSGQAAAQPMPITAYIRSRAHDVLELARRYIYVTDVENLVAKKGVNMAGANYMRPQTVPLMGETVGISFSSDDAKGDEAFVLKVFGYPSEPVALQRGSEQPNQNRGVDSEVDELDWRIAGEDAAFVPVEEFGTDKNNAHQLVVTTRSARPADSDIARPGLGERLLWANPLVEDVYVYSVLSQFVPEGRVHLNRNDFILKAIMDILSNRLYAERLLEVGELRTRAMYMAYVNGISKVVTLWNEEIEWRKEYIDGLAKYQKSMRRSPRTRGEIRRYWGEFGTIKLKMHDLKPYSQAVAELSHNGLVFKNLLRLLYRLMWKMMRTYDQISDHIVRSGVVFFRYRSIRWQGLLKFARDPTDAPGDMNDSWGHPFDTDETDARYARYVSGDDNPRSHTEFGRRVYMVDEVKQLRRRAGRPLTGETWPPLKQFLFEEFEAVTEEPSYVPGSWQ